MIVDSMLTTTDNPFDPFTQWDAWFAFDTTHGYHTCEYLARVTYTSPSLSEPDQDLSIEQAMAEILEVNITGNYVKVFRKDSQASSDEEQSTNV